MAAFNIGTAGFDIGTVMSMMGIEGASSFEQNFSRHSYKISAMIRDVCGKITPNAMCNAIIATIEKNCYENVEESIKMAKNN